MEISAIKQAYSLYSIQNKEKISQNAYENLTVDKNMDKVSISEEAAKLYENTNKENIEEDARKQNDIIKSNKASDYTEKEMLALLNGRINGDLPNQDILPANKALLQQLEGMIMDIENKYPDLDDLYANGYNELTAMRGFVAHAGEYVEVTMEDAVRFMKTEDKSQHICYINTTENMSYEDALNYVKSVDSLTDIILLNARMWADDSLSEEYKNEMYQQLLVRFMEIDGTPESVARRHLDPVESARYHRNHNKPLDMSMAENIMSILNSRNV